MKELMRCLYCGLLQDEPSGVKQCLRCGGELAFESHKPAAGEGYLQAQMELDQINAPSGSLVDRYLMITLKTPADLPAENLPAQTGSRPPFSLTAVLDTSGSMRGPKFENAMQAVNRALLSLYPGDSFSLVTFAEEAAVVIPAQTIDARSAAALQKQLQSIRAGGSTALFGGMTLALEQALRSQSENNLILLLSDGHANIGETGIEETGRIAWQARQKHMTVSSLGLGEDYNEALMVEIASQGGGRYYHLLHASEITPTLNGELGESASAAARKVEIVLTLPNGSLAMPLSPMYPAQMQGGQCVISAGDIPLDIELEIPVRLSLPSSGEHSKAVITGEVKYDSPAGQHMCTRLNQVAVRFVSSREFRLKDGLVAPVAERVLGQMKDMHLLNRARLFATSRPDAVELDEDSRNALRDYAGRLGHKVAEETDQKIMEQVAFMATSPQAAKAGLNEAFSNIRKNRKFN